MVAEGVGKDEKEAKLAAYRDAVSRVVGTLVDAETLVKNDEVISEKILAFSGGFIKTSEVLKTEPAGGGLVRVRIKATVERLTLVGKLNDNRVATTAVRGDDLLAEKLTREEAQKNATDILAKLFADLPKLMKAEVRGKPTLAPDGGGVETNVVVTVDPEQYAVFVKKAVPIFDKMAVQRESHLFATEPGFERGRRIESAAANGIQHTPRLGPRTPTGFPVWVLVNYDQLLTRTRWNLYWLPAAARPALAAAAGNMHVHLRLLDAAGEQVTEDELPVGYQRRRLTDDPDIWTGFAVQRERFDGDDRQTRESARLWVAPVVYEMRLGGMLPAVVLRHKTKLTDRELERVKEVRTSVEIKPLSWNND